MFQKTGHGDLKHQYRSPRIIQPEMDTEPISAKEHSKYQMKSELSHLNIEPRHRP